MRAFRAYLNRDAITPVRDELKWLAGELGGARDLEVLRERLASHHDGASEAGIDLAGVDDALADRERAALTEAYGALEATRAEAVLNAVDAIAADPPFNERAAAGADEQMRPRIKKAWKRAEKAARSVHRDADDAELHRALIKAKRARYLADACAEASSEYTAKHVKTTQTLLGEHQDAVVAAHTYEDLAASDTDLAVAATWLADRERAAREDVRKALAERR